MTPDKLIIQDFEFQEYPVDRVYSLGGKMVIQISEPTDGPSNKVLAEKLDSLQHDYDLLEKERDELSDELKSIGSHEQVKSDKDELESLRDSFDQIEQSISSFATNADIRPTTNEADNIDMLHEKYMELQNLAEGLDDEISGLKVDNRALADAVFRQEQTIARLEELLAAKEKQLTNI